MLAQLAHERDAEPANLVVGFALRVKIRPALASAHRQTCQGIFEGLFKTKELEDGEVDGRVKSEAAFVRTQGGIVLQIGGQAPNGYCFGEKSAYLDTVPLVHLCLAFVVLPDNAELDNALRYLDNFEGFAIGGVFLEEGAQASS